MIVPISSIYSVMDPGQRFAANIDEDEPRVQFSLLGQVSRVSGGRQVIRLRQMRVYARRDPSRQSMLSIVLRVYRSK